MGAELKSGFTIVDGRRMYAVESEGGGGRPILVLVHGVGVSSRSVQPVAEELAAELKVAAPDLPGHGRSDDPPQPLDVAGLADALAGWMRARDLTTAVLLGNSFGCQVVAEFAVRHPKMLVGAILQGPTTDPHARGFFRQIWRWVRNSLREPSTQQGVTFQDWKDAGMRTLVATARYSLAHRIEDVLPKIDCPALVVRGTRDPIIPQRWAEEAAHLLPNGRLVVVPDVTHTIVSKHPAKLAEITLPFVRDVWNTSRSAP